MRVGGAIGRGIHRLKALATGYSDHGANTYKNKTKGWLTTAGDARSDIDEALTGHSGLRARSRDLYMSSPLATGAAKAIKTGEIGAGLTCKPSIDHEALGITAEQAADWENVTRREWERYANTKAIDAGRRMTFGQIQALVRISEVISGDCFILFVQKKHPGDTYRTKIKIIEADNIATPPTLGLTTERDIRGGIELDEDDQAKRYYIVERWKHALSTIKDYKTIDAYGKETGRPNILHVIETERPGQVRGVPLLAPVMELVKQHKRYIDAEVEAAVNCAFFATVIKSQTGEPTLDTPIELDRQVDAGNQTSLELASMSIIELNAGEDIANIQPTRPNPEVGNFLKTFVQLLGAATEIPAEVLLKNFTASYSASRGALLEAWKRTRAKREWDADNFCRPVYEEWLAEAVTIGKINAPGFFADPTIRQAWSGSMWPGPSQGQLNPLQEANAAKVRIEEELSTREREAAEMTGTDWEYNHRQRVQEEKKRREDGTVETKAAVIEYAQAEQLREENNDDR